MSEPDVRDHQGRRPSTRRHYLPRRAGSTGPYRAPARPLVPGGGHRARRASRSRWAGSPTWATWTAALKAVAARAGPRPARTRSRAWRARPSSTSACISPSACSPVPGPAADRRLAPDHRRKLRHGRRPSGRLLPGLLVLSFRLAVGSPRRPPCRRRASGGATAAPVTPTAVPPPAPPTAMARRPDKGRASAHSRAGRRIGIGALQRLHPA